MGAYSKIAWFYDFGLYLTNYYPAANFFVKQLPFEKNESLFILDAGCGTGLYTKTLLKIFPRAKIISIDVDPKMIQQLKDYVSKNNLENRVRVHCGDILNLRYKDYFDLIVVGGVLEHLNAQDDFSHLTSFLREDGVIFNSPVRKNLFGKILGGIFQFTPYDDETNFKLFSDQELKDICKIKLPFVRYAPMSLFKYGIYGKK